MSTICLTMRFRLRDKHTAELSRQARAVNDVWNYCNETQQKAARDGREWLTGYDLKRLTAGAGQMLGLHSHTIQQVALIYGRSRTTQRRPWLRFRGKKSLGWVPFNKGHVRVVEPGQLKFHGVVYETMHWRELPKGAVIRAGSFSQDARGRWYINCPVEMSDRDAAPCDAVGIDLGLKEIATLSSGEKIENHRHYRRLEQRLGLAQRANKRKQVQRIHAKIVNARKDHLHKASADIAARHNIIVVGDVSPSKLSQTRMAKSVLDAGWASFKNMLRYKAIRHNGVMIEVNEAYSSQDCSACGSRSGPQGLKDLGMRRWECGDCGATHDRDVNAASNIARVGLDTLVVGTPLFNQGGEQSQQGEIAIWR